MRIFTPGRINALRIALPYAIAGGLWILFSDMVLESLVRDMHSLSLLQTYKGWFYVLVSAAVIYFLAHRLFRQVARATGRLHQSRQDLTETQRAMSTLMKNLPGMAYRCSNDDDWSMEFVSSGCLELTGYTCKEMLFNKSVAYGTIVYEEDRDMVWRQVQAGLELREPYQLEYRIRAKDGRIKWVWEQGCGVFNRSGELIGLEGYIFDVTDRHAMQDELNNSQRLTHIGQAASTIIHDLKSPMQVILGHIELLRTRNENPRAVRHFDIMEQQLHSMNFMSRELLDYARGETNLTTAEEDIVEFLDKVVDTYKPTFAASGIVLRHQTRSSGDASPNFVIDHEKIWRAIMNLIGNAREAMSGGGEIQIRSHIDRRVITIDIEDNGPGIPEDIQPTLFDPFVTFGKSNGTGLGLAISKKIVESHRGSLTVQSVPGSGAVFTLRLPRTHERSPQEILEEERTAQAPPVFHQAEQI